MTVNTTGLMSLNNDSHGSYLVLEFRGRLPPGMEATEMYRRSTVLVEEERLLRVKDVIEKIGISRSRLFRLVAADKFPQPIRIADRAARWRLSQGMEWMDSRPDAT